MTGTPVPVRWPIPQEPPADLFARPRRDRTLRLVAAVAEARIRWSAFVNRGTPAGRVDDHAITVVVGARRVEARETDVCSIEFVAPDGGRLPRWYPGAHLDVVLPSGKVRQYSLCGDPSDRYRYRIAVRRIPDGGGGSIEVHDALTVGRTVTLRGPRNAFPFVLPGHGSTATRLHFVAGGIGITPILPMIRLADRLGVDWSMVYVGRSRATIPFLAEVESFGARVTVRTDDEHGIPTGADLLPGIGPDTAVYCCGPVPMTAAIAARVRELAAAPRAAIELHSERFSAPPVVDGRPFTVELARSGRTVEVPADRSALEEVLKVRPDTAYSCRQGFCRTCVVKVLDGSPEHRETVLTADQHAAGEMLLCVSRCAGERLVLDL
ncbi:PDR/VanB family oxidoreductase [Nocardia stercoris]|uniref:Oxidoreductase n=1 Tax=Nocardia stercoris TaxID=2483361 RepID=A0A3M2KYF6_9NOCA|nr:PDR/VanB family oxidoreductase [Nocardia stercoris]RMI29490.1 oxidoreductase [Nocardia stercoris]